MTGNTSLKHLLGPRNIFWVAVSISLLAIVGHLIKNGQTISKIDLPGIMNITFDEASKMVESRDTTEQPSLSQQQLEERQQMLMAKIKKLEDEAKIKNSSASLNEVSPIREAARLNLSGLWTGDDGVQYNISQNGNEITFEELNPLLGVVVVGNGDVRGNVVDLVYESVLGSTGQGELAVTANGRQLSGVFHDNLFGVDTELLLRR